MTAPTLCLAHATQFSVSCTWQADTPAVLLVTRVTVDQWAASIAIEGWAPLFLREFEGEPSGHWTTRYSACAEFPTAQDALNAAWATDQITEPNET